MMQFRGYHINNLKSYRKYFCFLDAVDALENGAYGEWLAAIPETIKEREAAPSEDDRVMEEIRLLLEQYSESGKAKRDESFYQTLFLLFYKLAHQPVTDVELDEINRLANLEAEKQKRGQIRREEKTDAGMEISLTGKEYGLPVWKREEDHQLFVWKKLVNNGSCPVSVRIADGERMIGYTGKEEDAYKEYVRCLNPGGYVWVLTRNGGFVRWGRRVQVHQRSFACVDRKGCLSVDGYPVRGEGMVDFSFDRRTGILGVGRDGSLRQYSALELDEEAERKGKTAFAWLRGKNYLLVKEDGTFVSSLTGDAGDPADVCSRPAAEENICELPFPAIAVSVSEQLIGFETPDSRVGVWDREQKRVIWMEGTEWNSVQ